MRLLITDEHVTFREFLKSFLSSIPEFQVAWRLPTVLRSSNSTLG